MSEYYVADLKRAPHKWSGWKWIQSEVGKNQSIVVRPVFDAAGRALGMQARVYDGDPFEAEGTATRRSPGPIYLEDV